MLKYRSSYTLCNHTHTQPSLVSYMMISEFSIELMETLDSVNSEQPFNFHGQYFAVLDKCTAHTKVSKHANQNMNRCFALKMS